MDKAESEFYLQKRRNKPPRLSGYCRKCTRVNYLTPRNKVKQKENSQMNKVAKQNKYSLANFRNLPGEVWKDITDFEGFYQVSNLGRVRSIKEQIYKIRSFPINKKLGYRQAGLCKNGLNIHKLLHRVIASAFIPNPNNYSEVNHIDGDRANNDLTNLEWCTHQQNVQHAIKVLKKHGSLRKLKPTI